MKIAKILATTDGSARSRAGVEHAVALAEAVGAEVELLHVAPRPADYYPLDRWIWGEKEAEAHHLEARALTTARERLEGFVATLPEGARAQVRPRLELGTAHEVIVKLAGDEGHDLIVMSTRGAGGLDHLLMGSVTERVVRRAPCPVLTVPG